VCNYYCEKVRRTARFTSSALASLAILHVAWGLGSTFPFRTRRKLADAVIGSSRVPPPLACFVVAGALATGAGLVSDAIRTPSPIRRLSLFFMGASFAVRGALGFTGRTSMVSPGSDSATFLRLDRQVYSPLCLLLSVGSIVAARYEDVGSR
jgi:hypothetical protein